MSAQSSSDSGPSGREQSLRASAGADTEAAGLNSPARRFWRTTAVLVLATLVIGVTFPNVVSDDWGVFPWVLLGNDWAVTAAYPPVDAFLRVGDRVNPASLTPDGRLTLARQRFLVAGDTLHLVVERVGHEKAIAIESQRYFQQYGRQMAGTHLLLWVKRVTASVFIVVAAILVLMRPSRMTWGFFLFALGSNGTSPFILQKLTPALYNAEWFVFTNVIEAGLATAGLWMFASRFPSDSTAAFRSYIDRLAPAGGLSAFVVGGLASFGLLWGWPSLHSWIVSSNALNTTFFAIGILSLVGGYFTMSSAERQRLKWVVAGFGAYLAAAAYMQVIAYLPGGGFPASWTSAGYTPDILNGVIVLIPATVAYAVLKHYVLDINFVISRALVYATMTSLIVIIFALIDWFFVRKLAATNVGVLAEIVAAIALGFWLNGLHHNVDASIDRVFFQQRYRAELGLARIARALPHATSLTTVNDLLALGPAEAFDLASAAVFSRGPDGSYQRQKSTGWPDSSAHRLEPDDTIVLHLRSHLQAFKVAEVYWPRQDLPRSEAYPALALPVVVRNQVVAIIFYGAHNNGTALDPDEIRIIGQVAVGAGAAYDHLEAEAMRRRVEEQEGEIESLRVQLAEAQIQPA